MIELIERTNGNRIKYFISKYYEFYKDNGEVRSYEDIEDCRAVPPGIAYNKDLNKWCLTFDSADMGGYDVQEFEYYFDSLPALMSFLGFTEEIMNQLFISWVLLGKN